MVNFSKAENIRDSKLLLNLFESIYDCPKPVIGKINGHAFGGGIGLIAVCDITISFPGLKFSFSEVNLGIIPSVISTFVSPRLNISTMRRLFITGERFDTETAAKIGLIDIVVDNEELDSKVDFYTNQVKSSGPISIAEVKKLIKNLGEMDINTYKNYTVEKISELRVSDEGQDGINAFLNKSKPKWRE
jgi:methylglutaconyl-CoA hydratase